MLKVFSQVKKRKLAELEIEVKKKHNNFKEKMRLEKNILSNLERKLKASDGADVASKIDFSENTVASLEAAYVEFTINANISQHECFLCLISRRIKRSIGRTGDS